jgi:hypothetical protein
VSTQTDIVVVTGVLCALFWIIAYVAIVYRGFKDRTYGVPVAALAANLSWEAAYAFFLDPLSDHIHVLSIPWFFIDVIILWQCLKYGGKDWETPWVRKYFKAIVFAAIAIAFPIVYLAFDEFNDPLGEYTGFGINFMMSLLFVSLLLRRDGGGGQSMYIAIFKWLGTLFAYIATAFTVTTSHANPWPESVSSFVVDTVTHTSYPLTPLISVLYLVTFFVDIVYIFLLRARLMECQISPWRRI